VNYTAEQVVGKNVVWIDWDGRRETSKCIRSTTHGGVNIYNIPDTYYMLHFDFLNTGTSEFSVELAVFNKNVEYGLVEVVDASDVQQNEEML
jgi:hypothetical protein